MTDSNGGPLQPHQDDVSARPGEDLDAWVSRVRPFAVVDPNALARERDRLAAQAERSRLRTRIAMRWLAGSLLVLCVSLVLNALVGLSSWAGAVVAFAVVCGVSAGTAAWGQSRSVISPSPPGRNELVRITELDSPSRELLARIQKVGGEVLSSTVYRRGLLDNSAISIDAALRRHEWETAANVREITSLRAALDAHPVEGPMTTAVLEAQRRAVAIAQDHATARIDAIEKYAARVKAADAALRDNEAARKAAEQNGRYLDLVARTAADKHAIEEWTELTERVAATDQALQNSIRLANQAGAALVFPDETARSAEPDPPGQTRAPS